jgi:cell division initiation protein
VDLTPQTLREVEFREKLRGYHPDDVDDFLEQAAVALEGMLGRLRAAEAAASRADAAGPRPERARPADWAPASSGDTPSDAEAVSAETLHRTLLLAQRTADAAVAEAEESARQLVDNAREEADRILAAAEGKAAIAANEAKSKVEAAIVELEQRRAGLEREVSSLQSWAAQQRDRLRDVLTDQVRALDIWLATSAPPKPPAARPRERADQLDSTREPAGGPEGSQRPNEATAGDAAQEAGSAAADRG